MNKQHKINQIKIVITIFRFFYIVKGFCKCLKRTANTNLTKEFTELASR